MELKRIHADYRGSIDLLEGNEFHFDEVTVFYTVEGMARGGCIHPYNDEYTTVIDGWVEYVIGEKTYRMGVGESIVIPKNTPHYFVSLTDSVVLEWGATPEEKKHKHPRFREIVEKWNNDTLN